MTSQSMHPLRFFFFTITLLTSTYAHASLIKAPELLTLCKEIDKGEMGEAFDNAAASRCQGYLAGFFDTVIVLEQVAKEPYFCIPSTIPKATNARILENWIKANDKIAPNTTASVALFSAYQRAFPCPKKELPPKK